jgi:hypothetical protein
LPADKGIQCRIAKVSRALIEIEVLLCLQCPVQQGQGQSGKRVNVCIYGLAAIWDDDAETNVSPKYLLRRNP